LAVPVSFDVVAELGDQAVPLGHLSAARKANWSTHSGRQLERRGDTVDPAIEFADLILTPNSEHLERHPQIKEFWGKKILFPRVPVERFDSP
jgi:hypothetical protein